MSLDLSFYQQLSDDEILNLARDEANLTDQAKCALTSELSRRNLSVADVQTYETETRVLEEADERRRLKLLNPRFSQNKKFWGRGNFVANAISGCEEYDATLWFVVFWFPLIPLGTYRVERNQSRERWWDFLTPDITVVTKLPLNWEQILGTWLIAVSALFVAVLTLPHILPLLFTVGSRLNRTK